MKYPEEILRERIEVLEDKLAQTEDKLHFAEDQRDMYKERFERFVGDMLEDAWRIQKEVDQKFADLIEVIEDVVEHD